MSIKFTQFLRPNGRQKTVFIDRPPEIESRANEIVLAGYRFEIEELTNGMVSMTITGYDPRIEEITDVSTKIVPNGSQIPEAVDQLIKEFQIPERI